MNLVSDSHLKLQFVLEDINNLLNTGEIPFLYESDERAQIIDQISRIAEKEKSKTEWNEEISSEQQYFNIFLDRVKNHLSTVLVMSPLGDDLKNCIWNFPSIISCTTIDYFKDWPSDAL